jgi:mono/diheme cytochrome c family protein
MTQAVKLTRAGALIALVLIVAPTLQVPAQDGGADTERGRELYYRHGCYGCHGFNGETGAQDLVGTGSPIVSDEALFITFLRLRADQAPLLPSTRMPNYPANALSDADARDIFAFVTGLRLDAPETGEIATFEAILDAADARD